MNENKSDQLKGKTLADFDKLLDVNDKCHLMLRYMNQSKMWMERVGLRGQNGRWISNIKAYRPDHFDLAKHRPSPQTRTYLIYAAVKTMAPEIISKFPIMQVMGKQENDDQHSDQMSALMADIVEDGNFTKVGQETVMSGVVTESALLGFRPELDKDTGAFKGKFYKRDIFSWLGAPGFTGDGMDLWNDDALFAAFRTPANDELLNTRYAAELGNVKVMSEAIAKEYSTPGVLGQWEENVNAALFNEFYWVCTKDGRKYIRGVHFVRAKADDQQDQKYKIVFDEEIDSKSKNGDPHIPVWRYVNDLDTTTGRGTSVSELGAANQKELNLAMSNVCVVLKRNALPIIFLDKDFEAGLDESIVSKIMAGLPIRRNKPTDMTIEQSTSFNPGYLPFIEALQDNTNINTGIYQSLSGDQKFSQMPMGSLLALKESAMARVRLILKESVAPWQQQIGRWLLKQILDNNEQILDPDSGFEAKPREVMYKGEPVQIDPNNLADKGPFDVSVVVAAGLPKGSLENEARARELGNEGYVTPLYVIENLAEQDTEKRKEEYLEWNGIKQHMAYIKAEAEAEAEFQQLVRHMMVVMGKEEYQSLLMQSNPNNLKDPEEFMTPEDLTVYKQHLDAAWEILDQFPTLINDNDFKLLPGIVQAALLLKFYKPPDYRQAQGGVEGEGVGAQPEGGAV